MYHVQKQIERGHPILENRELIYKELVRALVNDLPIDVLIAYFNIKEYDLENRDYISFRAFLTEPKQ